MEVPKIGSDDPNAVEQICPQCKGTIPVSGRVYCVTGVNWCKCPPRHNHITRDIKEYGICPACDAYHICELLPKNK